MLSKKMEEALNKQIVAEMYSSNLYLAMAASFEAMYLGGFAKWMQAQAKEEFGHAMKIYAHIHDRQGRARIGAVDAPPAEWASPLAAFETTVEHEKKVTGLIHKLVALAETEKDYATRSFLQWFVDEQVEEEKTADEILNQLKLIGDQKGALFMLNNVLGARQ